MLVDCTLEYARTILSLVVDVLALTLEFATKVCNGVVAEEVLVCASIFLLSAAAV
jgi:hypothetical protein